MQKFFTEEDIYQIKQQGGKSFDIFNENLEKIAEAIKNGITKKDFIQLAQLSKENTEVLNEFFSHDDFEELTPDLMNGSFYKARQNIPDKRREEEDQSIFRYPENNEFSSSIKNFVK